MPSQPTLTVIAGPNGSGKSTLSRIVADTAEVVDPDEIARVLNPVDPARAALAAGRQALHRCRTLLDQRASFIVETTLAGHNGIRMMLSAKDLGYRVRLVYICLGDLDLHNERVLSRVAQGGHDVPEADIGRRRIRSLARSPEAMLLADEALIFDNSDTRFQRVLMLRAGKVIWRAGTLPAWAQTLLSRLE